MAIRAFRMAFIVLAAGVIAPVTAAEQAAPKRPADPGAFTVTSPQIQPGARIGAAQVFNAFGCAGANVSPELHWTNAPAGTQSFAVMMYDPDAPTGSGWWHWVVWNLPAATTSLPAGAGDGKAPKLPTGAVQGNTDFGAPGYGGPCPPPGDKPHRYFIRVHALKVPKLDLPANATAAMVGFNVNANSLATAELQGTYSR